MRKRRRPDILDIVIAGLCLWLVIGLFQLFVVQMLMKDMRETRAATIALYQEVMQAEVSEEKVC